MRTILINKDNFVACDKIQDATTEVEVSDEIYEKLIFRPFTKIWKYVDNEFVLVDCDDDDELRILRSIQCFPYINRSQMWYSTLSDKQKEELQNWYQAWLDVTETKKIPEKLAWLD